MKTIIVKMSDLIDADAKEKAWKIIEPLYGEAVSKLNVVFDQLTREYAREISKAISKDYEIVKKKKK